VFRIWPLPPQPASLPKALVLLDRWSGLGRGGGRHRLCRVALMTQLDVGRQASAGRAISAGSMPGSTVFARRASSSGPTTISPQVKCRTYSPLRGHQHGGVPEP